MHESFLGLLHIPGCDSLGVLKRSVNLLIGKESLYTLQIAGMFLNVVQKTGVGHLGLFKTVEHTFAIFCHTNNTIFLLPFYPKFCSTFFRNKHFLKDLKYSIPSNTKFLYRYQMLFTDDIFSVIIFPKISICIFLLVNCLPEILTSVLIGRINIEIHPPCPVSRTFQV